MGSKHTPGPWSRNIRANGKYPVVFAGRNQHVALVQQQKDGAETEANIDLIAAAPDMLAALSFIVNDAEPGENAQLTVDGYNRACAAIAKARGEG